MAATKARAGKLPARLVSREYFSALEDCGDALADLLDGMLTPQKVAFARDSLKRLDQADEGQNPYRSEAELADRIA